MRLFRNQMWILAVAAAACAGCLTLTAHNHPSAEDSPAIAYFDGFRKQLDLARQDIGHISTVADGVADKFIDRKMIYAAPNQDSFLFEQLGRASGLVRLEKWDPDRTKLADDILLLPLKPTADYPDADAQWVNNAHNSSATVIAFSSPQDIQRVPKDGGGHFEPSDFHAVIDNHTSSNQFTFARPGKSPRTVYTSGMINMLNGWMFTGELTAACTRRGLMPVFWLSFAIDEPRGYPRAAKYSLHIPKGRPWGEPQLAFHNDMAVPPIQAGKIANQYLDHMYSYMDQIVERSMAKIEQGKKVFILLVGHAFPWDVPRTEWRDQFILLGPDWTGQMRPFEKEASKGDLFILLCMPTYDRKQVKAAQDKGMDVIVMSAEHPDVSKTRTDSYLWVPAPWPIEDGAVRVPGYDIPLLPVTGIMNGVIYYALRSEVEYRLALKTTNSVSVTE